MSASSDREPVPQRQIGELMTDLGLITEEQLATVLEVQQRSERPLGQIIVELGFASGAAVAHALAMQSGGALRTEFGFALGIHPDEGEAAADEDTAIGLPKLRLASSAVAPPVKEDISAAPEPIADVASEPEAVEEVEPDQIEEVDPAEDAEPVFEEPPVAEQLETVPDGVETRADEELVPAKAEAIDQTDPAELETLRSEVKRLEAALAEAGAAAGGEQERRRADVARLESILAEAQTAHEKKLAELVEERDSATAELARFQATLADTQTAHEQELANFRAAVAEAQAAAAAHEHRLTEEQERQAGERDELAAQRERLQQELGDALERLAAAGPAAEERDGLRAQIEQFEARFAEAQTTAAAERERLLGEIGRLESALAEAQTSATEQQRRLAEERERHSAERDELTGERHELTELRDRLQQELGDAFERLATVGPAAEERDQLRAELERVHTANAETQEEWAAERRQLAEERHSAQAELAEAKEMLVQAERVRESQIALTAERDRALAELEQLRIVAADAQAEAEERMHLLAEEQDRHDADRESLVAQRRLLEAELGDAIERLAAAASAADRHEEQLQAAAARLRALAAELAPNGDTLPAEPESVAPDAAETEPVASETESEPIDYSLFVPSPNGYDLVPQTGIPPQAGQRVELVFPDREEPALFEVVRSGRTLPGGDVCVYLAQV